MVGRSNVISIAEWRSRREAAAMRAYMSGNYRPYRPAMTLAQIMDRP